jgi:succinate dehydrogenase / fumarate reductase iron-sulfur subunit
MEVTMKVFRYNPETDKKPHFETYKLDAQPTDRVLDLLEHIKWYIDGTLSFRRSCAHGVCGSDAMRINGRNRLACKVLVKDLGTNRIQVEPILGLRVLKDMIVDFEPFFEHYREVMPFLLGEREVCRSSSDR